MTFLRTQLPSYGINTIEECKQLGHVWMWPRGEQEDICEWCGATRPHQGDEEFERALAKHGEDSKI